MITSNTSEVPTKSPKTATHRALASESRQALLDALARHKRPLDAREAGNAVKLHRNTARVHLRQLAAAGLVSRLLESRIEPGRPRVLYELAEPATTDDGGSPTDANYRDLARMLASQLAVDVDVQKKAVAAGKKWASIIELAELPRRAMSSDEAIESVTKILDGLGFDPTWSSTSNPDCIELHRCPFVDVAREHRSVVCAAHLGMIQETFEKFDASVAVTGLEPLVTDDPLLCIVRLTKKPAKRKSLGKAR